jgi:hypothetical protein
MGQSNLTNEQLEGLSHCYDGKLCDGCRWSLICVPDTTVNLAKEVLYWRKNEESNQDQ